MIRAHFTDNETGWVEPVSEDIGDGTFWIVGVPWTTDRFGYMDRVLLVPSTECSTTNCRIPQVGEVVVRSNMYSYVVTLRRQKQKNLRRLMEAIGKADPKSRCANLQGSLEVRVATLLDKNMLAWKMDMTGIPFRVDVLPFYPGKIG